LNLNLSLIQSSKILQHYFLFFIHFSPNQFLFISRSPHRFWPDLLSFPRNSPHKELAQVAQQPHASPPSFSTHAAHKGPSPSHPYPPVVVVSPSPLAAPPSAVVPRCHHHSTPQGPSIAHHLHFSFSNISPRLTPSKHKIKVLNDSTVAGHRSPFTSHRLASHSGSYPTSIPASVIASPHFEVPRRQAPPAAFIL
jgi:hypothetical protein